MSITVMSLIWDRAPYEDPSTMLVLLALGDWANENGVCWPSVPIIADKARQSERNTQYILRRLRDDGMISVEAAGGGRGLTNRFFINLERLQHLQSFKQERVQPLQGFSRKPPAKGCNPASKRVQSSVEKGAIAIAPEPLEPSDPSFLGGRPAAPAPAPGKTSPKKTKEDADRRFAPLVRSIAEVWKLANPGTPLVWDARSGGALNRLLAKRRNWPAEKLAVCIGHRFLSRVNLAESPHSWIGALTDYARGPLDEFKKPLQAHASHESRALLQAALSPFQGNGTGGASPARTPAERLEEIRRAKGGRIPDRDPWAPLAERLKAHLDALTWSNYIRPVRFAFVTDDDRTMHIALPSRDFFIPERVEAMVTAVLGVGNWFDCVKFFHI